MCGTTSELINTGMSGLIPPKLSIQDNKDMENFDEYGFFEEMDAYEMESPALSCPKSPFNAGYSSKSHSPISFYSEDSLSSKTDSSCSISSSCSVICEVEDDQAPITCRYFTSGESVFICIEGFRIVQESCNYSPDSRSSNEVAEYKVKMSINGVAVSVWRRLRDFRNLAEACIDYIKFQKRNRRVAIDSSNNMSRSIKAWQKVEKNRPYWNKTLSTKLIVTETTLLKVFMKYMLFEAPSLDLLVEFMRI